MNIKTDAQFWNDKYSGNETGWDIGYVSTPIKEYIDQITDKNIRILIPGCGNSYEAEYLLANGFRKVTVLDISELLVAKLREKFSAKEGINIIQGDFFDHSGEYDLILEQTFFCALDPALRSEYARQMNALLAEGGTLAGVLFNCEFQKQGPPFGGDENEYISYFEPYFSFHTILPCYNSILPRSGNELFIIFRKKHKPDL